MSNQTHEAIIAMRDFGKASPQWIKLSAYIDRREHELLQKLRASGLDERKSDYIRGQLGELSALRSSVDEPMRISPSDRYGDVKTVW